MCTGIELMALGAVGALGGAGMQLGGQIGARNEMEAAASSELNRQRRYQQSGSQAFEKSFAKSTPQSSTEQIREGTRRSLQELSQAGRSPVAAAPSFDSGSTTQNRVIDAGSQARVGMRASTRAPTQGYNDWQLQQLIKDLQADSAFRQNSSFARASANVLPMEMLQAQQSYAPLQGIGSLLGTAGGLVGTYGATRRPALSAQNPTNNPAFWNNKFLSMFGAG